MKMTPHERRMKNLNVQKVEILLPKRVLHYLDKFAEQLNARHPVAAAWSLREDFMHDRDSIIWMWTDPTAKTAEQIRKPEAA